MFGKDHPLGQIGVPPLFIGSSDTLCQLKVGNELFIGRAEDEPNDKMEFRVDVSLIEPGVVECKPVVETIQHLADLVSNTVMLFKPCLS